MFLFWLLFCPHLPLLYIAMVSNRLSWPRKLCPVHWKCVIENTRFQLALSECLLGLGTVGHEPVRPILESLVFLKSTFCLPQHQDGAATDPKASVTSLVNKVVDVSLPVWAFGSAGSHWPLTSQCLDSQNLQLSTLWSLLFSPSNLELFPNTK